MNETLHVTVYCNPAFKYGELAKELERVIREALKNAEEQQHFDYTTVKVSRKKFLRQGSE